jgi:hypothetical protein
VAAHFYRALVSGGQSTVGQALPELVQDLVLADDHAVEPNRNIEEVPCGCQTFQTYATAGQVRQGRTCMCRLTVIGCVQLNAVAGAQEDDAWVVGDGSCEVAECLALLALDGTGVDQQGGEA